MADVLLLDLNVMRRLNMNFEGIHQLSTGERIKIGKIIEKGNLDHFREYSHISLSKYSTISRLSSNERENVSFGNHRWTII